MNPSLKSNVFSTLPPNVMACLVDKLTLQSVARLGTSCKEVNIGTIKALQRLRLVKQAFFNELESAFVSRKPVALKLRYFSFEARKKPNFNLRNRDKKSLRRIKASTNIKLLLEKKIIGQKDLNVLFDEDLKVLEYLYEESQKANYELFDEIPDAEDAAYICRYIVKGKMSLAEALELTPEELSNLANRYISYFVITDEIDIKQAKNLSPLQFSILSNKKMIPLIISKKLTVQEALVMSEDMFSRLKQELIYSAVARGELSFAEVEKLTAEQVANAIRIWVMGCSYGGPYRTFGVLHSLGMSARAILAMDYDQIKRISSHYLHKLLRAKKLSVEEACCLTESQVDLLGNRLLCKLFLADKLSLERAERLSEYESVVLRHSGICKLIARGKVTFEDATDPSREDAMNKLCHLWDFICEDKVSVEFVERLSEEQLKVSENAWVRDLIWGGICKVEDVVEPEFQSTFQKIDRQWVCQLLTHHSGIVSLEEVAPLSDEQVAKLDSEWIYKLITEGFLSVDDAANLDDDAFDNLNNARIYKLIAKGKLDIEEAMGLSVDLYDILSSKSVSRWISRGNMSLEDAKELSPEDLDDDVVQGETSEDEGGWERWSENEASDGADAYWEDVG